MTPAFVKSLKISLEITKQQPKPGALQESDTFSNAKTFEESVVLSYTKTYTFSYYYGGQFLFDFMFLFSRMTIIYSQMSSSL